MDDILNMLMQEIERGAFPYFYAQSEYRQQRRCALQHSNWLEEHLNEEEMAHLEQMQNADISLDTLEREAIIRTAIAIGVRLALPS